MTKIPADWTEVTRSSSDWSSSTSLDSGVKLSSTTVKLNSGTVTLYGFSSTTHFNDNKIPADWTES